MNRSARSKAVLSMEALSVEIVISAELSFYAWRSDLFIKSHKRP